jgi:hypothetical protein
METDTRTQRTEIRTSDIRQPAILEIANGQDCTDFSRLQNNPSYIHSHEYVYPDAMRQNPTPNTDNPPDYRDARFYVS